MKRISTVIRNQKLIKMYCGLISELIGEEKALYHTSQAYGLSTSTVESILKSNPRLIDRFKKETNKCKIKLS